MRLSPLILLLTFVYLAFVLFAHLDDHQLEIYDEARRSVNAVEMASGESHLLVPTYAGEPDHWGTKPPVLVWCQAFWVKLLGPGELPIRLPSVLATLMLCGLFTWWARRDWGSPLVGALASLVLVSNWHFMGNHGARSGDFDALLILFQMAQIICFYRWVDSDKTKWLWLAGLAVALAGWTKGVAGGFILPGIGLWLLLLAEGRRKLLDPKLYGIIGIGIAIAASYYFLRENIDPGYLQLVADNELGGRFNEATEGHQHPWYFYLSSLIKDPAGGIFFSLVLPAAVFSWYQPDMRKPAMLCLLAGLGALAIVSTSATKLYWYQSPALPPLAMLTGSFLYRLAKILASNIPGQAGRWVGLALLAGLFAYPMSQIVERVLNPRDYLETRYSKAPFRDFMRLDDQVQPPYTIATKNYNPNARFYVERARYTGQEVDIKQVGTINPPVVVSQRVPATFLVNERVVICHTETWKYLFDRFILREEFKNGPCKLVRLTGERVRE